MARHGIRRLPVLDGGAADRHRHAGRPRRARGERRAGGFDRDRDHAGGAAGLLLPRPRRVTRACPACGGPLVRGAPRRPASRRSPPRSRCCAAGCAQRRSPTRRRRRRRTTRARTRSPRRAARPGVAAAGALRPHAPGARPGARAAAGRGCSTRAPGRGRFVAAARAAGLPLVRHRAVRRAGSTPASSATGCCWSRPRSTTRRSSPASLDAVTLWHVLEHVDDPRAALRAVAALAAPGRRARARRPEPRELAGARRRPRWFHLDLPRHRTHFTPAGLDAHPGGHAASRSSACATACRAQPVRDVAVRGQPPDALRPATSSTCSSATRPPRSRDLAVTPRRPAAPAGRGPGRAGGRGRRTAAGRSPSAHAGGSLTAPPSSRWASRRRDGCRPRCSSGTHRARRGAGPPERRASGPATALVAAEGTDAAVELVDEWGRRRG